MNQKLVLASLLYLYLIILVDTQESLEIVEQEALKNLILEEKNVVILFSDSPECKGKCETLESTLFSVREDIVEDTGGWVVRSYAPSIAKELGVGGSAIMFFRSGRPLLYTGSASNDEVMLQYLLKNKKPIAYNLTDSSFEHETQAGTGATTGDWLVMFVKADCPQCVQFTALFEAVGANLLGRKNIAILEREHGPVTARRFGVKTFPSFVLFRHGKLYKYDLPVTDVGSLTSFAIDGFRNAKGEDVPQPKSPFDDLTEAAADWLKENPGTFFMSAGGILACLVFIYLLNKPPPESWVKKNTKKKKRS